MRSGFEGRSLIPEGWDESLSADQRTRLGDLLQKLAASGRANDTYDPGEDCEMFASFRLSAATAVRGTEENRQFRKIVERLAHLADTIREIHPATIVDLNRLTNKKFNELMSIVLPLDNSFRQVYNIKRLVENSTGRSPNMHADKISRYACAVFFNLTGEQPSLATRYQVGPGGKNTSEVYGEFYNFLRELFDILNVNASPESQGRTAIVSWKKWRL